MKSEAKCGIGIVVVLLLWGVTHTDADYVAVNDNGYPSSPLNRAREIAQGESYWRHQVKVIDQQLADYAAEFADNRKQVPGLAADLAAQRRERAEEYRENPELRPTHAELTAQTLRDKADFIEFREEVRLQNEFIQAESERLKRIRELALRQADLHR